MAVSAFPFVCFLLIAASRLTYRFDIEWMEGALLGHGVELLETGCLYKTPSQDFIPFIYPPLYTYLVALGARLFGVGYAFPRLVSILCVVATSGLLAAIIWKELRSRALTALAFLGPFAMYGVTGYWFDLVRVDGFVLLLVIAGLFVLLYGLKRGGANFIACACLLALAAFGKQSFSLFSVAIALYLVLGYRWRDLAIYAAASALFHALFWGGLLLDEGRLALVYIVNVPQSHGWWETTFAAAFSQALKNLFFFQPVLTALSVSLFGVACWLGTGTERDRLRLFGLLAAAAVIISLTTRAKWGGYENAYIPTYFALNLLCFYSVGVILSSFKTTLDSPAGGADRQAPGQPGAAFSILFLGMVLLSGVFSAWGIDVGGQRVGRERRVAARQLAVMLENIEGRVLFPSRNMTAVTGQPDQNHYHTMAARDLSSYPELFEVFQEDNEYGFRSRKFQAIVMDVPVTSLERLFGYRSVPLDSLGIQSDQLASMTGRQTCPRHLYYLPGVDPERLKRAISKSSAEF